MNKNLKYIISIIIIVAISFVAYNIFNAQTNNKDMKLLFSKNKYSKYIAGSEIDFENSDELKKILLTQGLDKNGFEFFKEVQSATEIIIDNNKIVKVKVHFEDEIETEKVNANLPIKEWQDREVFFLVEDVNGSHKLGGKTPNDFILPTHSKMKTPFIYIGSIDTKDKRFEWINLPKLHIAYPIYECNYGIFLDYSNPNNPKIINPENITDDWYDKDTKGVEKVVFKEHSFSTYIESNKNKFEGISELNPLCGVPLWIQAPDIPICPKTGKVMRFVCQINSNPNINLIDNSDIENLPFADYLNFADDGILYIFFEPESRIMYLNIQFT